MQVVRAADGETGEERAERHGKSAGLGDAGGNQADGDGDQKQKFRIFGTRYAAQSAGDDGHGQKRERYEEQGGFAEGPGRRFQTSFGRSAENRDDDGHEDHGDVFDQSDANHHAAVIGAHGIAVGEQAREDHGAGDRNGRAHDQALNHGPTSKPRSAKRDGQREQNS